MKNIITLFLLFILGSLNAQHTVKGVVKDSETKKPIAGAIVTITGSTKYAITKSNGAFSIPTLTRGDTIFVNSPGYFMEAMQVANVKKWDVGLTKNAKKEDTNVNVGYGSLEKKTLTSSVLEVDEKGFNKGGVTNIYEYLRGKVPGLSVDMSASVANSKPRVMLRGISSLNAELNEPLIVIDGVPGASLDSVDPIEVTKISVLKDASAQAIYGTRATGGVLLISTKKSKNSKSN
jgi:TonB-dependent starch-binding outer membrane protein SusC